MLSFKSKIFGYLIHNFYAKKIKILLIDYRLAYYD